MNKEQIVIIIVALAALVFAGAYIYRDNGTLNSQSQEAEERTEEEQADNNMMEEEEMDGMEDATANINNQPQVEDNTLMTEAPEGAYTYEITNGSEVSYTVQKRFLSKADEQVTGTTTEVTGDGWFDEESGTAFINANLDFSTLATDSPKRDEDTAKKLDDTSVAVAANLSGDEGLVVGEETTLTVPVQLTINGVTNTVPFEVTTTVTASKIDAEGTATIKLSEFNVTPPSLVGVYTVDDDTIVNFVVVGN